MPLLSASDHPAIRAAIDARVTSADLSDEVIAAPVYRDAAEAEILRRVPDAEALVGAARAGIQRAAIYYCAALLARQTPVWTSETISRWSGSRAVDLNRRAAELLALSDKEINDATGTYSQADAPGLFYVVRGSPGRRTPRR